MTKNSTRTTKNYGFAPGFHMFGYEEIVSSINNIILRLRYIIKDW